MTRPRDRAAARRALPRFAALPLILVALLLPALATAGARAEDPAATAASGEAEAWRLCVRQTSEVDAGQPMPAHLLTAISRIEAGRWKGDSQEILAWPWTVTAEGRGRFLPSKEAAIAEVEALRRRGVRNIDVGCMQINLYYHPAAFDSLEAAFDPAQNVAYALRFLVELREKWGTWTRAVGNYHSNTPRLSGKYRAKVFLALNDERRKAIEARRAARLAAREAQADGPDRRTN